MAPQLARARLFSVFEDAARLALPPEQAAAFKAIQFAGGTLTVACKSSSAAAALKRAETSLKEAVARAGGEIERFRFLLAPWR